MKENTVIKKTEMNKRDIAFFGILFVILVLYVICLLIPLIWGFYTSLKSPGEWMDNPVWPTLNITFDNYILAFSMFKVDVNSAEGTTTFFIHHLFMNSLLYALGSAFVATMATCITAYIVAKFNYKFSKIVYAAVILIMAVPIVGALPSTLDLTRKAGLYDNMLGMWIVNGSFYNMYFLVFYATFKSVAKDYSEAAEIDGASNFSVMIKIMLPLVKTTIGMVILLYFISFWNDYQTPMMFLPSMPTVAYGMFQVSQSPLIDFETVKITGGIMMILPILIIFLFMKNKLMGNLTMGGIKG